jgi:recombination protein RecR
MIPALEHLVDCLTRLPTIGRKSAWRLALHLLERPQEELDALSSAIGGIKRLIHTCPVCYNYTDAERCSVCASPTRDSGTICVVEKPTDVLTLEKAGRYRGVYHVLGGLLSPINGVTVERLRVKELTARLDAGGAKELILALGGSGEAEATDLYLARLYTGRSLRITRLARGLPAGTELEYIDQITLTQALQERIEVRYRTD